MSYPKAGDAQPLHPDQYGSRARVLNEREPLLLQTSAELDQAWEQEKEFRALWARVHTHAGCGHPCDSGACIVMAGVNDPLCIRCQLAEISDAERHQAARRAREKTA